MRGGARCLVTLGVVALLSASACTKVSDDDGSKHERGRVVGVGKVLDNRNDTQLQVDQLVFRPDGIELDGGFTNGSSETNEIELDDENTYLTDEDGRKYKVRTKTSVMKVAPRSDRPLALTFRPAIDPRTRTLTVHLNDDGFHGTSEISDSPEMVVADIGTRARDTRPSLPDPVAAKSAKTHPGGTSAHVDGIAFAQTRIGVRLSLNNGGDDASSIAGGDEGDSYLQDDLGNKYPMQPPEDATDDSVDVPPGKAMDGVLAFGGRVHPAAKQLTVHLNATFGGDSEISSSPRFTLGPYEIAKKARPTESTTESGLPDPLDVDQSKNHANGSQLQVKRLDFENETTSMSISFLNGSDEEQSLNGDGGRDDTVLFDDQGNTYPLLPPEDNPELSVSPGKQLDATLVFSGRIDASADSVRLETNRLFGGTSEISSTPKFRFGPYQLSRGTGGSTESPAREPGFAVGLRSDLKNREIGASQAREVARTTSTYDGEETDDGVRLTVPAAVLFDFDSTKLRPDGQAVVRHLAEVLRYYDGAPATVAGYTDSIGSPEYNEKLSTKRATRVVDALVEDNGIEKSRLTADGRGESDPVARNTNPDGSDNPDGRQKNRRVVLEIKTKKGLPR